MRISLLQEAGRDSCEESGRGPSIKKKKNKNRGKKNGVALGSSHGGSFLLNDQFFTWFPF